MPGGVSEPLDRRAPRPDPRRHPRGARDRRSARSTGSRRRSSSSARRSARFANFPTLFMGLVDDDGTLEHYDGKLRFVDAGGQDRRRRHRRPATIAELHRRDGRSPGLVPQDRRTTSRSATPRASTASARWRASTSSIGCGTPRADQEWAEFRELDRGAVLSSFHYHYARLIEILYALEQIEQLLARPGHPRPRTSAPSPTPNNREGVGVAEAPRGTLHPPLQGRRRRPDHLGQPDHRHRPQQPRR